MASNTIEKRMLSLAQLKLLKCCNEMADLERQLEHAHDDAGEAREAVGQLDQAHTAAVQELERVEDKIDTLTEEKASLLVHRRLAEAKLAQRPRREAGLARELCCIEYLERVVDREARARDAMQLALEQRSRLSSEAKAAPEARRRVCLALDRARNTVAHVEAELARSRRLYEALLALTEPGALDGYAIGRNGIHTGPCEFIKGLAGQIYHQALL